jgi:hypothetical protein
VIIFESFELTRRKRSIVQRNVCLWV